MPRLCRCLALLAMLIAPRLIASAQTASVMQLLQSPRQFVERRVSVSGYYFCTREVQVVFADRAAAERLDYSRSIWVDSEPPVYSELRPAHVIGVFRHQSNTRYGIFGMWSAQIINATIHLRGPTKTFNQAMQRTAGRSASPLSMTSTFHLQRRSLPPAVAHLGSR